MYETTVWLEIARQVPAVAAFLVITAIIVRVFINSIRSLTNDWMAFLTKQSESTTAALKDVAEKLDSMGTRIVGRLEQHDHSVETRVVNAIERYNGRKEEPHAKTKSTHSPS